MSKRTNIIILLLTVTPFSMAVTDAYYHFQHLGVEHGLSQSTVYNIFQDSDGYLWFGTQNGVNKYDGYEFKTYKNEANNPESLSDGFIQDVNEDINRNIWVGTSNGLNCIDYASGKITRFYPKAIDSSITSNTVSFFIRQRDDTLLVLCGNTLLQCNPDKSVRLYKKLQEITSAAYAVKPDNNRDIYISTSSTLFIYSENWDLKQRYALGDPGFPQSTILCFLPDKDGIWMGTIQHGIYFFDYINHTFTQYDKTNTQLSNNYVRTLLFSNDSILIGTFEGLNLMNKRDYSISPLNLDSDRYGGLGHFSIHSMLLDKDQTLWIGTYAAGISYSSPYFKTISFIVSDEFSGIIGKGQEDKDGNMWFATEGGGLLYYNPVTKAQKLYPIEPLSAGNHEINIIKSLLIDNDTIYCATHLGTVYKFSIAQKKYELLHRFSGYGIFTLLIDSQQRLWIPTSGSHYLAISESGKTDTVYYLNNNRKQFFPTITTILEYQDNVFILGSSTGRIYLYDMNKHTAANMHERLPLGEQEITGGIASIVKDTTDIYIATTKMGLFRFDNNLQFRKQYGYEDGITDSYISSLVIDKNNDLWVAAGNDIFRLNRDNDKFTNINPTGPLFQELTLRSAYASSNGVIYFPGNKGVISFNPQNLMINPVIPPVYITSLTSNNQDVTPKMKILVNENRKTKHYSITLKSNENNLTIKYTTLNFIHSDGNKYSFRMENVDELWHNVGNRREAYYSNLRPGHYTFRLIASNNDGIPNPEETTLSVRVKPPFYKTEAAYTIYILLLSVTVVLIVQYQNKRRKLEQDIRIKEIEQEKLKELHEERMRMYAQFSHELKTPLTLIMNPLQELSQRPAFSPEVKQSLHQMEKNTDKMLSLVNNLMDIQKYLAGNNILNKKQFNFSVFMEEVYGSFEQMAHHRNITFQLINELEPTYSVYLDETEIEKVFFNLLSNAFKYTPSKGAVTITVQRIRQDNAPFLSIQIADTGKGFSNEEANMIFEPFYKFGEDLHRQMSGTGIGLSLVRTIVTQHNGFILVNSKEQAGATFTVLLPDTETQPAPVQPVTCTTAQPMTNTNGQPITESGVQPVTNTNKQAITGAGMLPVTNTDILPTTGTGVQSVTNTNRQLITGAAPLLNSSSGKHQETQTLIEQSFKKDRKTVLLVENDRDILIFLEEKLSGAYFIQKAENGKEALAILQKKTPDIVISDIMMPVMSGIKLCQHLKNHPDYYHIPVILLTGSSDEIRKMEGFDTGADAYITKPFDIRFLKVRIKNLIENREKIKTTYGNIHLLKNLGIEEVHYENRFLIKYISFVKANISNQNLNVPDICKGIGVSRANFYRKVKAITPLSPTDLVKFIRLDAGAKLLIESDKNISEIAQMTGFSTRSFFARTFKAEYSVSPSDYRRNEKK